MTDLDLLSGAIAARLRLLPEIDRLFPARSATSTVVRSVGALLDAVSDDPTVVIREVDGRYVIETSVGVDPAHPASRSGRAVAAAVRDAAVQAGIPLEQVRVRISSVG